MVVPEHILKRAMELYLQAAYSSGNGQAAGNAAIPENVRSIVAAIQAIPQGGQVPLEMLEKDGAASTHSYILRLGQPLYPHMKLVLDPVPEDLGCLGYDFLLRVDAHDRHLHASPDSPDAAWLATIRRSNKELGDRIECAWAAAGLPTFKEFLRRQLERRRNRAGSREKAS